MNRAAPQFISNSNTSDPVDELLHFQNAIRAAGWWQRSGVQEHWPVSTETAIELLRTAGEYDVDHVGLLELIERRLLARPSIADSGTEFEWTASDLVAAGGLLEARQQWQATPSQHDAKKHPCQIILEQARAAGEVEAITAGPQGGARFDVRHLLALLAACDSWEGRQKTLALLRATLEVDHGILI